jgi:hypothetical protein
MCDGVVKSKFVVADPEGPVVGLVKGAVHKEA